MKKILFIALLLLISGRVFAEDYDMCCPMESCSSEAVKVKENLYMHIECNKCILDKNRAFWKEIKNPKYEICAETAGYNKCVSIFNGYSQYDDYYVEWWVRLK